MKNPLKEKMRKGEVVTGTFVRLGHPDVTEWLSRLGFDFLLLDTEHAPTSFETLQRMMQSMNGTSCVPIVRPHWNDPVAIKRILDMGAYGVLIPWVNSKEEAVNAVRACKYAPDGVRGFGPRRCATFDPEYFETANEEILIAVQIETEEAIRNLDEILSVGGIDAFYVGPFDLSVSLFGTPPKWDDPRFLEVFDKVLKAAKKWEKAAGVFTTTDTITWATEKGFTFNTVGEADGFLIQGAQMALEKAHEALKLVIEKRGHQKKSDGLACE